MSYKYDPTGCGAEGSHLNATSSVSYVPPYRANAHHFISEHLASAVNGCVSPYPHPDPPLTSPYVGQPGVLESAKAPDACDIVAAVPNPLGVPPPPRPPVLDAVPVSVSAPVVPPNESTLPSPSSPCPVPELMSSIPMRMDHGPPAVPPSLHARMPPLVPPPSATPHSLRIPELSVILARGRLSRVPDLSPEATGEDIYRAFCPGGEAYANESDTGAMAATVTAAVGVHPPLAVQRLPPPSSLPETDRLPATTASTRLGDVKLREDSGTEAALLVEGVPATRGRLPPGWERRNFHGTTFYLDHVSREAHEQEPWVVWWGRAGNTDYGSA